VHTLGQTLGSSGQFTEAATHLGRSLGVFERQVGATHPFTLTMRGNYGVYLLNAEDPAAAEPVFRQLAEDFARIQGPNSQRRGNMLQNLAVALLRQGRLAEAEEYIREAEAVFRAALPAGSVPLAYPLLTRSEIELARGEFGAAHRTTMRIVALLGGKLPDAHPARLMADCRLARALAGLGHTSEARAALEAVVARMAGAEGMREAHRRECEEALAALGGPTLAG
jgi:tetratricopeptide (TPR) repeat protein